MKYFTMLEMISSVTALRNGIDNTPSTAVQVNLQKLVEHVLDPARERLAKPIVVTSGYRCRKLNDAVGGVRNSQHLTGQAADIVCGDMAKLWSILKCMEFDQLIWERGGKWVHVSYAEGNNRKQVLGL